MEPGSPTTQTAPVNARVAGLDAELAARAGDRSPEILIQFARAFHFGAPLAYFAGRSEASLADEAIAAFDFVEGRRPGEIRVRVTPPAGGSSLVQATLRDQPFLLDTAREALRSEGITVRRFLHPILRTERDAAGRITRVGPRTDPGVSESFLHFEIEPPGSLVAAEKLEMALRESLREAAIAVEDYAQMRGAVESVARSLAAERPSDAEFAAVLHEASEFLLWLLRGNFVLLGFRTYDFDTRGGERYVTVSPRSGLGILRDPGTSAYQLPVAFSNLDPVLRARMMQRIFPLVSKANRESRVHRRARMDYIGIKKLSPTGEIAGEQRILGLFTAQAMNQLASEIPVLRRKLDRILARAQVLEGSHDWRQITRAFNGMPKTELLATDENEIASTIDAVTNFQAQEGVRVACRRDALGLTAAVLVVLPRDRFNAEVRRRIQTALAARFGAPPADYQLALGEEPYARLHFYFPLAAKGELPPTEGLERDVQEAIRDWDDRLRDEIEAQVGSDRGADLAARFGGRLPATYRETFTAKDAVGDLPIFDELGSHGGVRLKIVPGPPRGGETTTLLRLYRAQAKFYLSDVMPILTQLGLRVLDEMTFRVEGENRTVVYLHTIRVQDGRSREGAAPAVPEERWGLLGDAILALLDGRYENDGLGALTVSAGLSIRQIDLLRACIHYFRQLRVAYTRASMIQALAANPAIAVRLVEHFELKFRPGPAGKSAPPAGRTEPPAARAEMAAGRAEPLGASRQALQSLLDGVQNLTEDRVLRGLLEIIDATVRTDYFQERGTLGRISFKVESGRVSFMPPPVPLYEIFVHNAEMEGIHLRSGKVARGGIRWSDRRDDFRTEILGLMHTQVIKNAVIVPVGSKGGFVLKAARDAREELPSQVTRQYRTLITGMLGLTDNLVDGKVVHPPETVIYDGPDPYLVVAADKGTASFSDLANSIAAERRFWLDDAFASGGSRGYDHKKEGITARGAWECSRHLLRELGIDPDGEIAVAGIGDMSGDVFGNGLLLSQRFKLVAAFDHRHVFIDPSPDLKKSFEERRRLFALPRSSWADYKTEVISKGGGVYRRDSKRIELSAEAREALRTSAGPLTGEELVREVLKAPVDLLWNGGIGTYVKAAGESNGDVGDSRNDGSRIDAGELRARVVAEGGNLGFTQAARIECALRGVKINTDFIDNSAGVDLSDHEVNIKIGLAEAIRLKKLDRGGRDALLKEMTAEVCGLVLADNRQQTQLLSIEERASREDLGDMAVLAGELFEGKLLDPQLERFPDAAELRRRGERRTGLVRPELAQLVAFTKIDLFRSLVETGLAETAGFEEYLLGYFPAPLRSRFGEVLKAHPLRREIQMTVLTNELVNRMGVTFVSRLRRELGAGVDEVVAAYRAGRLLLDREDLPALVGEMLAAGSLSPAAGGELILIHRRAMESVAGWLLRDWPAPTAKGKGRADVSAVVKQLAEPFGRVAAWLREAAPAFVRESAAAGEMDLAARGVPDGLAARAAALGLERHIPPILSVARGEKVDPRRAAAFFFALQAQLGWEEIEAAAARIPAPDPDDRSAARALVAELRSLLAKLAAAALRSAGPDGEPAAAVEEFLAARGPALAAYRRALPAEGRTFTLGSLMVLAERMRRV